MASLPEVIIVTGASSCVFRATALAFATCGDTVVLTARRVEMLSDVARECEALDASDLAVPTDVADEAQVGTRPRCAGNA
jgi:NADP-dependent 3-hydroxy acid dehydrogenase YdfG